jgi:hypothetical protein
MAMPTIPDDFKTPISLKLALAWASLMFLYIYNDYFSLYRHGIVEGMMAGRLGPLGEATEGVLSGVSVMMAIPSLMVFLSAALWPRLSRWLNIILGLAYSGIEVMTLIGAPISYQLVVVLEVGVSAWIVWQASQWRPRAHAA